MTATILVVDDEPDLEALVLQKFRRQIRDGAVQFVFARDGIEALQSIEAQPQVDMVVSDINMPRMDGLSLLAKLQEADDKKSTIIVSAYGDMSNIRTAMNRGAFDFLTKPIDFGDLELTIDKIIGDAIQILFNAPGDQSDYATRAIACAHDLDGWAQGFRERWKSEGVNFGATRIGVHAGPALVGNFGGNRFFDYTAYGDTVNIAARLEAANKFLGSRICVSLAVSEVAGALARRPVGDLIF